DGALAVIGNDATREVAMRSRARVCTDEPAVEREAGRAGGAEPELPLERTPQITRTHRVTVRIPDAAPQLEGIGAATVDGRGQRRREVGNQRAAVHASDALEPDQAVGADGEQRPRGRRSAYSHVERVANAPVEQAQ